MSYSYTSERPYLFTEAGQVDFLRVRDKAQELLKVAGAVMSGNLLINTGDVWKNLACIDRLVELGELVEVTDRMQVAGQHRIFRAPYR